MGFSELAFSRRLHSLHLTCFFELCLASVLGLLLRGIELTDGMLIVCTKEVGVYIECDANATVLDILGDECMVRRLCRSEHRQSLARGHASGWPEPLLSWNEY
jgi:hypothetical protein